MGNAIKKLEKLISEISESFDQTSPEYGTRVIESFNHSVVSIASKNVAYRISRRIRAYISIIKWNDPLWIQTIFEYFQLEVPENVILNEKSKNEKKKRKVTTTRTDDYKKIRAKKKRKMVNNNYKLKT
ncbi:hypothetical protein M9Y10_037709 [Tritrichomonas musculus]|uniref:Uncharacterized protein n=1 Tax=Tritrichomonas musculus TaxID=1915356 RepID=A0ABR2GTA3_9EUKA